MLQGVWLLLGLLLGLLAAVAFQRMRLREWLALLVSGALLALLAGWLGVELLGVYFATPLTAWVTVLGVVLLAYCLRAQR